MSEAPADGLVTAGQASELLDVPASTIRKWKERGDVVQADMVRSRGRTGETPLYRLEDLRPLAERYRRKKAAKGEIIRSSAAKPIDRCPVCRLPVDLVLTAGPRVTAVASPCMHGVNLTLHPDRVELARWTPSKR